ncbi:MAG: 2-amino-4-hydroxy-6-hydroxymethyldihydropteridine diphosphokinase [Chthoniobacterales bacterium]
MTRAGIALGSNVGDRLSHLRAARSLIAAVTGMHPSILASAIYETAPVGCEPGAENFLNAVIEIGYNADAAALHRELRTIEATLGRTPDHPRNAPRTVDLDLLYFGDVILATSSLRVPHPRMTDRRFVLQPLADIRAELVLPTQTRSVAELLASVADTSPVVRAATQW